MKRWVYADSGRLCGGCGVHIAPGKPVLRVTIPNVAMLKWRCENCAGQPVNIEHLEEAARVVLPASFERVQPEPIVVPFDARMAQTGEKDEA